MIVYDVLFKRGTTDEGRGIWLKCGVMLEKPDGKKSMKIDAMPVGPGWDGWLVISERRKNGGGGPDPAEGGVEEGPF